jgi:PAS domain S-box-containing protein
MRRKRRKANRSISRSLSPTAESAATTAVDIANLNAASSPALEALAKRFGEFVFIIDLKGAIDHMWTSHEASSPRPANRFRGRTLREIVPTSLGIPFLNLLQRVHQTRAAERIEYSMNLPEGDRWFITRIVPLPPRTRRAGMLSVSTWNVTDRKLATENLRKSRALLVESEQLSSSGSWELDFKSGAVVWSDNLYRLHGFEPGEVATSAERCLEIVHPNDREHAGILLAKAVSTRQPQEHEYRAAMKDGTVRLFRTRFVPFFAESGEPARIVGSTQDVTERRNSERKLQKSEALLAQAEQLANLGSWQWDYGAGSVTWSENNYRLRGWTAGEVALTQEFCTGLLDPADREFARSLISRAFESRQPQEHEYRCTMKDGAVRWFQTRFAPFFSESGAPLRLVGCTQDITERRLAEQKIQKNEALLAQAEQLANLGSWEWDLETNALTWSDHRYRMAGMDPSTPAPSFDSWWKMVHPGDRERVRALLDDAIARSVPLEYEARLIRPDGQIQVMLTRAVPVRNAEGRTVRFTGMSQDITERRAEGTRLGRSEALLDQAEEIAGFGCWEYDVATRQTILSKHLLKMYGFSSNERWDVERFWENVLRSDRQKVRQMVLDSIAQCKPFEFLTRYRLPGGTVRAYHVRGVPVAASDGSAARVRGVAHDITGQMHSEEELRRLSQELLRTQDTERRQIARNLHESAGQTLAALKMTLANLEDAFGENRNVDVQAGLDAARGLAEDAIREVRVLSYLMHPPMLDEAGLGPTLLWYARGFAERSGIETNIEVDKNLGRLPQQVETTVFRIVQEALTNVHRYSGSRIAAIRLTRHEENGEVRVEIQDQGCGLQPHPPGRNSRLGVGIAGMRERVKQLNGTFEIESVAGRGLTVRAVLPIVPCESAAELASPLGETVAKSGTEVETEVETGVEDENSQPPS